jgi:hypothetical protein
MRRPSPDDLFFVPPKRREKAAPHGFVLDALSRLEPTTHPMFGCLAVYVEDKIVLILRDKPADADNGVWIATTLEHHASLRVEFPTMRSISVFGTGVTGWQILPASAPDFEEAALRACALISAGDLRIGKVPGQRRVKRPAEQAVKRTARPAGAKEAAKTAPAKAKKPVKSVTGKKPRGRQIRG